MSDKFETWAVVELFGHDRIAGRVTEQEIAGAAFVRVDVPGIEDGDGGFSKLFGPSAIYSVTPVSEVVARAASERFAARPLGVWTPDIMRRLPSPVVDQEECGGVDEYGSVGVQEVECNACGERFPDGGSYTCPSCGSDDTEILE